MRCEVVAIGTELLLGQIIDTNSSWLGEQLALNGIDSHLQIKVGDNIERIVTTLRSSLQRAEAIICCGGLGPTQDDITREAIAKVMGTTLQSNKHIENKIRKMFASRGRSMPQNNLRQALVPVGATAIEDQPGTAPGLICPIDDKVIYAVPGVPYELKQMIQSTILSDMVRRSGRKNVIGSRVIKTWGHSESKLAEMLSQRIEYLNESKEVTLAFLASGIEGLKVRITARAQNSQKLEVLLKEEESVIRGILGDCIFGIDDETMESTIVDILKRLKLTVAIAELTSAGIASTRLSNADPGGSIFLGGIVPNSEISRMTILGLDQDSIGTEESATHLAQKVKSLFSADIGLSITGTHDQTGSSAKGETYLGIAYGKTNLIEKVLLPGDKARIGQFSVISLLNALRLQLCKRLS